MQQGYLVASFYKFVHLNDYRMLQEPLLLCCQQRQVTGSILLAEEGVNGMISGQSASVKSVLGFLRSDTRLSDLEHCVSHSHEIPFKKMKVRLKNEIVPLRAGKLHPNRDTGEFVSPEDWNALITDPEITVVDTRNDYEAGIGTFQGAINPKTEYFHQFSDYLANNLNPEAHKKIAMFCTGGIRCEKASAYMLQKGFREVYQLKGGILNYLRKIPPEKSLWKGECFVFDGRVSVGQDLVEGSYQSCKSCGRPISAEDMASVYYEEGVTCPSCYGKKSGSNFSSFPDGGEIVVSGESIRLLILGFLLIDNPLWPSGSFP